jgi:predicted dehydrogenase
VRQRLRAGIVGGGFMGTVHARAIRRRGDHVTRVVGSTPASSAEAFEHLGAERHTATLDELLDDNDIDVVHVCTPNNTHTQLVRAALAAGKHVVCEKPLATDPAEAAELTAMAHNAGLVATVPFVYRFYPMAREARFRATHGALGPLRLVHGSYLQDWLADENDDNWRVDATAGGSSRAFADIGVHWCDLMEFVTGHRITRLCANTLTAVPTRNNRDVTTEDVAVMIFMTDQGAGGSLTVSQISHGRKNRLWFSIDGAAESLCFDQEHPESLWVGRRDVNGLLLRGTSESAAAARYTVVPAGHPQGYQDCFDAFVDDTYSAIHGTTPDGLPTFQDGLRAARITDALLRSSQTASWVEVPA